MLSSILFYVLPMTVLKIRYLFTLHSELAFNLRSQTVKLEDKRLLRNNYVLLRYCCFFIFHKYLLFMIVLTVRYCINSQILRVIWWSCAMQKNNIVINLMISANEFIDHWSVIVSWTRRHPKVIFVTHIKVTYNCEARHWNVIETYAV